MKGEFSFAPLGSLVDVSRGISYGIVQPGQHVDAGIPIVRVTDIRHGRINQGAPLKVATEIAAKYRRTVLRGGELLLTLVGTVGETAVVPTSLAGWNTARAVAVLPVLDDPGARWVQYALQTGPAREYIHARLNTTVQATLNLGDVSTLPIPMPSRDERQRILRILGALDDKIELGREMNATLEAMARALFKSWFIDFDPVRAKADGRAPSGMDAETTKLFPSDFEQSTLGKTPRGWSVASIGDLADIVGGSTPSTKEPDYWDGGVHHWATPKDLSGLATPVIATTERKVTDEGLRQISSGLLPVGTVLLSSRAPIGYLGIAEVPLAVNQGFIAMKPRPGIPAHFLLRWAEAAHEEIVSRANGSTFLEISKSNFRPIQLVRPSATVLDVFQRLTDRLYRRVVTNEQQSRTLARTRDELLPRLLSGELSVADAEAAL